MVDGVAVMELVSDDVGLRVPLPLALAVTDALAVTLALDETLPV